MKPVKGFDNYLISEFGEVFSVKNNKFIKPTLMKIGYLGFTPKRNKLIYVHRAVAEAFIPNPNNYPQVNHKDGDKTNNNVSNLEWCTSKQNNLHAWKNGLNKTTDAQRKHASTIHKYIPKEKSIENGKRVGSWIKLHVSKKVRCKKCGKIFNSIKEAADSLDLRDSTLSRYLNGTRKNCTNLEFYINVSTDEHIEKEIA